MLKNILLTLLLCSCYTSFFAQNTLTGRISNEKGKPLAFVNILVNGDNTNGTITDIDGLFVFENIQTGDELHLSYIGYESLVYTIKKTDFEQPELHIQMKEVSYEIEEITIVAGENPAHRIIREVVKTVRRTIQKIIRNLVAIPIIKCGFHLCQTMKNISKKW